jgi:mono/diheme cytochrome c family protein
MFRFLHLGAVALAMLAVNAVGLRAQGPAGQDSLARGRYLAEEVGKCQECHSPRLENGELDKERWMKGAVLDFSPLNPTPNWHKTSPDITGAGSLWKRWGDEAMLKFMMTGLTPKDKKADPPMPAYTLARPDAEAVVAYLKSLK